MRILLQRVSKASVAINGRIVGSIDGGFLLLVGVGHNDTEVDADMLAHKITTLRIFNDEQGKFNRSLLEVAGGVLVVSQFTLYANIRKGRRPNFTDAAAPDHAKLLCDYFAKQLALLGVKPVAAGVFGAIMQVEIHNDGPVTVWLDSDEV